MAVFDPEDRRIYNFVEVTIPLPGEAAAYYEEYAKWVRQLDLSFVPPEAPQ